MIRHNVAPPSHAALAEALSLSGEIVQNIELDQMPLANIALKASRLARLLNEIDYQQIMQYEAGGYPSNPTGIPPEVWRLGKIAGRTFIVKIGEVNKEWMYTETIGQLEDSKKMSLIGLEAARDPDISIYYSVCNELVVIFDHAKAWGADSQTQRLQFCNMNGHRELYVKE